MVWGHFGVVHIGTLFIAAAFITALYFLLRRASRKIQIFTLGVFSFVGIAAIFFHLSMSPDPVLHLPLHLCSIGAALLPFAVFTRAKTVCNLLLVWSMGAAGALIFNEVMATVPVLGWEFFFYYVPHVAEWGIPVLLFSLRLVEKDVKSMLLALLITLLIYTGVHFANVGINAYIRSAGRVDAAGNLLFVNYMYTLTPVNGILQSLYNALPYRYWYMYLTLPLIVAYLGVLYAKEIVLFIRARLRA